MLTESVNSLTSNARADFKWATKALTKMSAPMIASRLAGSFNNFMMMLLIARLGHDALAAGALINSILWTVMLVAWGLLFGVGVSVGHAFGAGKHQEVGVILRESILLGIIISIPFTLLFRFTGPILIFFKQDPHLAAIAADYFKAFSWSVVLNMIGMSVTQTAVGISKPKLVTFWSIICIPLLLIPGYIFTFGKFGMPRIGIAAMGYANIFMNAVVIIISLSQFAIFQEYKKYQFFNLKNILTFKYTRELLSFGFFVSIQLGSEMIAFSVSTIFIGWIGEAALAAQQIVIQVNAILLMIPYGISQASSILVGQTLGARNYSAVRTIGITALTLGGICGVLLGLFYILCPKIIISLYLNPHANEVANTVKIATILLAIAAFSQIFDIWRTIAAGTLRGLFDVKIPMFVSVFIGCLLSIPISYLLGFYFNLGAAGIRLGFVLSFFLGALILVRRFYHLTEPNRLLLKHSK